jgi:hypothetical protein
LVWVRHILPIRIRRKAAHLARVGSRDHDAVALSRRDMLAGIGLAGLFVPAPTLLSSSVAEARTLNAPAVEPEVGYADAADAKATEHSAVEGDAADSADVTELSARHRRYWHRRYWRRRYRRRRYWRHRYWRRRYWRRRYYRRVW